MIDTAVILSAGQGSRLRESSGNNIPKPLFPINGEPLITKVAHSLYLGGIRNLVVVLGYEADMIKEELIHIFAQLDMNLRIVVEDQWDKTKSGVSLYAAKDAIHESGCQAFVCCMGDHLIEHQIITKLIDCYNRDSSWLMHTAVEYMPHIRPSTQIQTSLSQDNFLVEANNWPPYITHMSRDAQTYEAADIGLFAFTPMIFPVIKRIMYNTKDCDLYQAVDRYANTMQVNTVDIYPYTWLNINNIDDVKLAEVHEYLRHL